MAAAVVTSSTWAMGTLLAGAVATLPSWGSFSQGIKDLAFTAACGTVLNEDIPKTSPVLPTECGTKAFC